VTDHRIHEHPILPAPERPAVEFFWQDQKLVAHEGETISSALFANGLRIFGHHYKDGAPQGIFCANGQCAQCSVIADGLPVKSCMVAVKPGMRVQPLEGKPALPDVREALPTRPIEIIDTECLIIGGGPLGSRQPSSLERRACGR
jgi:sarcosine oxidase, subunit alpha